MKEEKIKRCKGTPEQIGNVMKEGLSNMLMLDRTFDNSKEKPVLIVSPAIPGHEGRGLPPTIPKADNYCTFYDGETHTCRLKELNLPMHQCRARQILMEDKALINFPKLWKQALGIAVVKLFTKVTKPILNNGSNQNNPAPDRHEGSVPFDDNAGGDQILQ